jgi:hypothetical protein
VTTATATAKGKQLLGTDLHGVHVWWWYKAAGSQDAHAMPCQPTPCPSSSAAPRRAPTGLTDDAPWRYMGIVYFIGKLYQRENSRGSCTTGGHASVAGRSPLARPNKSPATVTEPLGFPCVRNNHHLHITTVDGRNRPTLAQRHAPSFWPACTIRGAATVRLMGGD